MKAACSPTSWTVEEASYNICVFSNFQHSEGDNGSDGNVDCNENKRPELFSALVYLIARLYISKVIFYNGV